MNRASLLLAAACSMSSTAFARPNTVEFLPPGYLLSGLSTNGAVGCGNVQGDGSYETFIWTSEGGVVRLGRSTVAVTGTAAGSPDISHDGTKVSATILSSDNKQTMGIWSDTTGWIEAMPPLPPDGVASDSKYSSAWGLSGDGTTVTGFYYSNYSGPTRARPCSWSQGGGVVSLPGNAGVSCRVNASNFDGTIVGGWEDHGGPWWPTVWRNGVKMNINDGNGGSGGRVEDISNDGSVVVGAEYSEALATRVATVWTWNGSSYDMNNVGMLPGTQAGSGQAYFGTVSADGSIAGGSNIYTISPGADRDGIIWTPGGGLVKASDYVASLGLADQFSPTMLIREIAAISPDGGVITGIGLETTGGGYFQSFVIRLAPPVCAGDADGSGSVNFADITSVLVNFGGAGPAGDADHDGDVDFADVTSVLVNFNATCS